MPDHDTDHADVEHDSRFPSGEWTGFFLQPTFYTGRVKMTLVLTFRQGMLSLTGRAQ